MAEDKDAARKSKLCKHKRYNKSQEVSVAINCCIVYLMFFHNVTSHMNDVFCRELTNRTDDEKNIEKEIQERLQGERWAVLLILKFHQCRSFLHFVPILICEVFVYLEHCLKNNM